MSTKIKRTPKKNAKKLSDTDSETPSPTRRSRRLRGDNVEMDLNALEEVVKSSRRSRSRSRSGSVISQASQQTATNDFLSTSTDLSLSNEVLNNEQTNQSETNDSDVTLQDLANYEDAHNATLRVDFDQTVSFIEEFPSRVKSVDGVDEDETADENEAESEVRNKNKEKNGQAIKFVNDLTEKITDGNEIGDVNGEEKDDGHSVESNDDADDAADDENEEEKNEDQESKTNNDMNDDWNEEEKDDIHVNKSNHDEDDDENEDSDKDAEENDGSKIVDDEASDKDESSVDESASDEEPEDRVNRYNRRYEVELDNAEAVRQRRNKYKKSVVDDKFFCLAEMHEFLDIQDKLEEKRCLGKFEGAEKMIDLIEKYEAENLKPRSWELSGEVTADDRAKDALLNEFTEADFRAKSAPTITEETTEKLESIIRKRIKDKIFDDVERKKRRDELVEQYRAKTSFNSEIVRQSLGDVYAKEFEAAQVDKEDEENKLDPVVEEISRDMKTLFKKLDALGHYQFAPAQVKPEVKIVRNVASLQAEEVGPTASVEAGASLLAPEEVLHRVKAVPKAANELTETDRKRLRRKKKLKQKILAKKGLLSGGKSEDGLSAKQKRVLVKKKLRKRKADPGEEPIDALEGIPKKKKSVVKNA